MGNGRDLGDAALDGRTRLQKNLYDANAVVGVGFDMFDVIDRGAEGAFVCVNDAPLDLLGVQACILPYDTDDRDVSSAERGCAGVRGTSPSSTGVVACWSAAAIVGAVRVDREVIRL